jgi:octaprenyl-diphosphate synthase
LFSELAVVNDLCEHVRGYRGKMLRPALVLLSGDACGRLEEHHYTLSAVLEIVHMATLVHDDVLDEADLRRRRPTINRLQGNEAAVLLGDYLISHAFHLCSTVDAFACRYIGATTNAVCEGELQQVHHRGDHKLTVDQYLEIVSRKTAALTAAACMVGARYAGATDATAQELHRFGMDVGIAFQITDDILDIVGVQDQMGKTLGRDWDEGKLTLPVIHALSQAEPSLSRRVRELLPVQHPNRHELAGLLSDAGSIAYAQEAAASYVHAAIGRLEVLPPSEARSTLARLARMILERQV